MVCATNRRRVLIQTGSRDAAALIVGVLLAFPVLIVHYCNGPSVINFEYVFVARHWVREDSFYLFASRTNERRAASVSDGEPVLRGRAQLLSIAHSWRIGRALQD